MISKTDREIAEELSMLITLHKDVEVKHRALAGYQKALSDYDKAVQSRDAYFEILSKGRGV